MFRQLILVRVEAGTKMLRYAIAMVKSCQGTFDKTKDQEMLSQGVLEMFDCFSWLLSRGWIPDNNGDPYDDYDDGGKSFCGSPDNLDPLSTLFSGWRHGAEAAPPPPAREQDKKIKGSDGNNDDEEEEDNAVSVDTVHRGGGSFQSFHCCFWWS